VTPHEASDEAARVTAEYRRRDEGGAATSVYSFDNPGYVFYLADLEWELLRELRRHEVDLRATDVLEVGVGFGYWLNRLKEFGARRVAGIDILPWRIDTARERYPTLDLVAADAAAMPYEDSEFELVVQLTCLSSVLDIDVRQRIATEMWRVLAPGGLVLSYDIRPTPVAVRALGRLSALLHGRQAAPEDGGTPTVPVDSRTLSTLFGRPVTTSRRVSLDFGLAAVAGRSRALASALGLMPWLRTHDLVVLRKER
jgi:SAM-dependent methyltransferase